MHSTRTFVITVSNDRVSCRARTLNRNFAHAAAVIVHVPTVAWQPLAIVTSCLEQLDVDKSVNDKSARRLDQCDVTALRSGWFGVATDVPHSEVELQTEFKSLTAAHSGSNTNQHTDWTLGATCIISKRSVYAPHLVQSVRLHLYKYRGADNAHWISKNKMTARAVQGELCGANFHANIANVWVSCYNTRSARVLFVQHPREQGEWLRQNRIIRPAPSGAGRTTPSQPGHYPLNIQLQPWEFVAVYGEHIKSLLDWAYLGRWNLNWSKIVFVLLLHTRQAGLILPATSCPFYISLYISECQPLPLREGWSDKWKRDNRWTSNNRKYKDYVYRKMLVQEYLKK